MYRATKVPLKEECALHSRVGMGVTGQGTRELGTAHAWGRVGMQQLTGTQSLTQAGLAPVHGVTALGSPGMQGGVGKGRGEQ